MADKIKPNGMGGSNGGKNRYEGTESLKAKSTKRRRQRSRLQIVADNLGMSVVRSSSGELLIE